MAQHAGLPGLAGREIPLRENKPVGAKLTGFNFVIQSDVVKTKDRIVAAAGLLLVSPSVLFMTSLFLRNVVPAQNELARSAQHVVGWFADRPIIGLDVLLVTLPFVVFVLGSGILLRKWIADAKLRQQTMEMLKGLRAHFATVLVATATAVAGGVLMIVALHVVTD